MNSQNLQTAKIERWIALANLLPASSAEELRRKFDRAFGGKPQKLVGEDPRAKKAYAAIARKEREGRLSLEVTRPVKRRRGRPARNASRVETFPKDWKPVSDEQLSSLAHSVDKTLRAIADETRHGVGQIRLGREFDWTQCSPVELPLSDFRLVIGFNFDGTGAFWPDPYRQFLNDLNGSELFRIRRCPICDRLFFAGRRDKGACSPRCMDIHNVRIFRTPEKAQEYRDNRKWNEYRKAESRNERKEERRQ